MSPSTRGRSSGIPWQTTSFTEVQIDFVYVPYPSVLG